jgi:secretion/DNA translocation related TadE-like protein
VTRGDRGSGTVLVLGLASVLTLVAMLLVALASVGVARHRAASAADLAALAAADRSLSGEAAACAAAARAAAAVAAELGTCRLLGDVAEVEALVRPPGPLGALGEARSRARAGPGERPAPAARLR